MRALLKGFSQAAMLLFRGLEWLGGVLLRALAWSVKWLWGVRAFVPLVGIFLIVLGHFFDPYGADGNAIVGTGVIFLLFGLAYAGRSMKGFIILLTGLVVLGAAILIVGSIPERYGWWQFLLFPDRVGVLEFSASVKACLMLLAIVAAVVFGLRWDPSKSKSAPNSKPH